MDHSEMMALVRQGVLLESKLWADLGAGTGNFTRALADLLGTGSTIYALDRDAKAISAQHAHQARIPQGVTVIPMQADFTRPLALPPLDGLLMANALHFIRDQPAVFAKLVEYLKPGGRLLLVEYDLSEPVMWVPFPVPPARFAELADGAGFQVPTLVGTRRSQSSGIAMYAAITTRAHQT